MGAVDRGAHSRQPGLASTLIVTCPSDSPCTIPRARPTRCGVGGGQAQRAVAQIQVLWEVRRGGSSGSAAAWLCSLWKEGGSGGV